MDINYNKLNSFEAVGIFLAACGIVLGFVFMFAALPDQQQRDFTQGLSILNMEDAPQTFVMPAKVAYSSMQIFLDQFTVAFSEVMIFPENSNLTQEVQTAYQNVISYSEQIGYSYDQRNSSSADSVYFDTGKVLGASIDLSTTSSSPPPEALPYSFAPPNLENLKSKVESIESSIYQFSIQNEN